MWPVVLPTHQERFARLIGYRWPLPGATSSTIPYAPELV